MSISTSTGAYEEYRRAEEEIPARALAWNLYGTGVEQMGRDGHPEAVAVAAPAPNQLLIRVDAVGLCFSDVKLMRLGGDHPKLYGRDLSIEPTRVGHETSVTVVAVGDALADRFHRGQRLAIQPDIYVDGRSTAYGYTIPGGLIEYHVIGPEVLEADDGAYVIPVDERLGYAETALTEPWACVEAAYTQRRRLSPLAGGRMLIVGRATDGRAYDVSGVVVGREVLLVGVSDEVAGAVRREAPPDARVAVVDVDQAVAAAPFDDIILLSPHDAGEVSRWSDALAFRGLLNLVADEPLGGPVDIDIGRIHYHYVAYVGTTGVRIAAAYWEVRNRAELRPGGVTVVIGAAGPMGQMHIERALSLADGPRLVIGVDLDADRLAAARERLEAVASARHRPLAVELLGGEAGALAAAIGRHSDGPPDDVVVTAPSVAAVQAATEVMAPDGMLVVFAGVPVGTRAALDLSPVFLHGAQLTGTSGSRIADQALVVDKTLAGQLEPGRALAAVGGMESAPDALRALMEGRFPGKIVIFPSLRDLPVTPLTQIGRLDPDVQAALQPDGSWSRGAEALLFAHHLRHTPGQ